MANLKLNNVYINAAFSIAGPLEKEGAIKTYDITMDDYYFGEKTFEQAEIKMQRVVLDNLLYQNKLKERDIELVVGGELSNQLTATSYNLARYNIPFLGVYSACASYVESLIVLSSLIENKAIKKGIVITSSHNLTSEKQFRFPVEYGTPKPAYTTFTATASIGNIVTNVKSKYKITGATIGKVVDYGIKDAQNMGAIMAPAAADVLNDHLVSNNKNVNDYDLILTGDLGSVGSEIFKEVLKQKYNIKIKKYADSACEIYRKDQETYAGASGPAALPLVLWNKVLKNPKYKKVLIIGTGSLHSPVMVNQKITIPGIAHALSLEVQQ